MRKIVTMREALESDRYFASVLEGDTWAAWRVLLLSIMGEGLTAAERVIFTMLTERPQEPAQPVRQFFGVVGRRGGKSRAMGTLASYLSGCCDFRDKLAPGQRARLPVIAGTKDQADEVFGFLCGAFDSAPALKGLVEKDNDRVLKVKSQVDVQVRALSFRNVRGATNVAVICDELAYWRSDESATPDKAVIDALKPSLATTGGPLIGISSPYARKGVLYSAFVRDFGADGREHVLVAKGSTATLNPTIDPEFLAEAKADDPVAYEAEYECSWRDDLAAFLSAQTVEDAIVQKRTVLPYDSSIRGYVAFTDTAGGSGADAFTLAIAHAVAVPGADRKLVLDLVKEIRPPFSPDAATAEMAEIVKAYGLRTVTGDAYGGSWPAERFKAHGITYEQSNKVKLAERARNDAAPGTLYRSEIYKTLLPLLNAGRVELLDNLRLKSQLLSLERRVSPSGQDSINHPKGGHDDVVNAAAGAIVLAAHARPALVISQPMLQRFSRPAAPQAVRGGNTSFVTGRGWSSQ